MLDTHNRNISIFNQHLVSHFMVKSVVVFRRGHSVDLRSYYCSLNYSDHQEMNDDDITYVQVYIVK